MRYAKIIIGNVHGINRTKIAEEVWLENYLLKVLKDTTEYMESHLLEELSLDDISDNVNITKFHLLRIWKGATGIGLIEYVRKRRIACALGDLLSSQNNIDFIADKYGFGSERTFVRIFKEEYGTTPSKWRKNPFAIRIQDRFNVDFMGLAGDGLVYFKSISVIPEFSIAGLLYQVDIRDNYENQTANKLGVDFFYNHRKKVLNPVGKDIYYGYTSVPKESINYTYYQPSIGIDMASIVPPAMTVRRIPTHKYGVFTYMGLHSPEEISSKNLKDLWELVFDKWMPTVEFKIKENYHFEYINYARCSKQYCECDLYFPMEILGNG